VEGRVIDRATDLGLADVNIYTVGREWSPAAVTGSDGRFSITDVCSTGLRLTARKGGYESALNEYGVQTGSSVVIVMYTLGEYIVNDVSMCSPAQTWPLRRQR